MSQDTRGDSISRRDFIYRSARAGAVIAAAGSLSFWLYDAEGPGPPAQAADDNVALPDFSLPALGSRMSITTGSDRSESVRAGIEAIGGIGTFIQPGDRVLIKVNAAFASAPILSATTNPQLLSEVVKLCYQAGASSVVVTDNPINDPESCFVLCGIGEAARASGAKIFLPKENLFQPTTVEGGSLIKNWPLLFGPFAGVSKLIGMAPVKDHHRSGASMTMKNWYGLLGGRRNMFHQNIHQCIAELAMMVKPTLVILDGTTTMMTNGPTGGSLSDLKQTDVMIVSTDQVAADAFGATLLGKTVQDLPYILKAQAAGVGTADYDALKPIRDHIG